MSIFGKIFEQEPGGDEKKSPDSDIEKRRKQEEALVIKEIESIPLTPTNISLLSSEEVHKLHERIVGLQYKIERNRTYLPPSEPVREMFAKTEKEILNYLSSLSKSEQEFFHRLIDGQLLESDIEEKFREYDKEHWQEVFQNEINKGITPFGDERSFMIDIYKKQGINLENPTEEDRNKFFEGRKYQGGAFSQELKRRRLSDFQNLDRQITIDIEELFWALFRVDGKTLADRELKQKLLEINRESSF